MSDDYEVGYGKPPKEHQFKEGNCANPKGRGKGVKNFNGLLKKELAATITVVEDGKKKKVTKQSAIVKQIVAKALKGDEKVFAKLVPLILALDQADAITEAADSLSDIDREMLKRNAKQRLISLQDDGGAP